MTMKSDIRKLSKKDIKKVAAIASKNFSGLKDIKKAHLWIRCNFLSFPRMQYYVAELKKEVVGYILWSEKGGFRENAVFELEQIAVAEKFRNRGIGKALISKSLSGIKKYLNKRKSKLKIIEVTTRKENPIAIKFYKKNLGAKAECTIKDFLRGDEVVMIARKN